PSASRMARQKKPRWFDLGHHAPTNVLAVVGACWFDPPSVCPPVAPWPAAACRLSEPAGPSTTVTGGGPAAGGGGAGGGGADAPHMSGASECRLGLRRCL